MVNDEICVCACMFSVYVSLCLHDIIVLGLHQDVDHRVWIAIMAGRVISEDPSLVSTQTHHDANDLATVVLDFKDLKRIL